MTLPNTVRDAIRYHRGIRPNKIAIRDLGEHRTTTYAELDDRIDRLARLLHDGGVRQGDRVALLALNSSIYFELQYATARLGAIVVFLNTRLTVPELGYIVGDCRPKFLLWQTDFAATAAALHQSGAVGALLHVGPDSDFDARLAAAGPPPAPVEVALTDTAIIMYTSGTTGRPKGALITHGMIWFNTVNVTFPCKISSDAVHLVLLPLFHIGGLNSHGNPVLHAGGTLILRPAFDPGETLRLIGDSAMPVTHISGVTAQYQMLALHPAFDETDLSNLRFAGIGGSKTPISLLQKLLDRGVPLGEGFGMTETSPGVSTLDTADMVRKIGSIGRPLLLTEVRVVGEDGTDMPQGEVGELWVRGPNVTPGYWQNPEASAQAFHDGWFRTGDVVRMDEEGYYYIVDRRKDMYISGGENVYPAEVENLIYALPQIAEAAVIGIPDPQWGETGLAIVVLRPEMSLAPEAIHQHLAAGLARFKVPRRIEFVTSLPRNAGGKVLKHLLRAQYA